MTAALAAARPGDLPLTAVEVLNADPDISSARIWLLDMAGESLTDAGRPDTRLPVAGSEEGRAASTNSPVVADQSASIPISLRGHVLGVMSLRGPDVRPLVGRVSSAATLLAQQLVGSARYGDSLGRLRHEHQLSVSATVQHTHLPMLNYRDERVEVVGRLEPAYAVAGDLYDYAVNPEAVHLAIFDAVGHDLRSTTLSTLAVGAYRRGRRAGAPLGHVLEEIDGTVAGFDHRYDFVTGVVARLDAGAKELHLGNAGHPEPLLVRGDAVLHLRSPKRSRPFGLGATGACVDVFDLEAGDVVVLYTDGVIEARDPGRHQWGVERLERALLDLSRGELDHLAKTVLDTVVSHVGSTLGDDAALLLTRVS